ncbi:hypothetical protein ACFTAO_01735 [Paenibacillus rhizoplanae]
MGLQAGLSAPAGAAGSASSRTGTSGAAAGAKTAGSGAAALSHAEAVYKGALPLLSSGNLPGAIAYMKTKLYAVTPYQATVLTLKLENLHKALLPPGRRSSAAAMSSGSSSPSIEGESAWPSWPRVRRTLPCAPCCKVRERAGTSWIPPRAPFTR